MSPDYRSNLSNQRSANTKLNAIQPPRNEESGFRSRIEQPTGSKRLPVSAIPRAKSESSKQ